MSSPSRRRSDAGFTLIELLLAFALLLVGMTGVIALFSAGLSMEREGSFAYDSSLVLDDLRPTVIAELRARAEQGVDGALRIPRTQIPGWPGLDYEVEAEKMPEDVLGHGFLVKITLLAPGARGDRRYSHGWLPMTAAPDFESSVQRMLAAK